MHTGLSYFYIIFAAVPSLVKLFEKVFMFINSLGRREEVSIGKLKKGVMITDHFLSTELARQII